MSGYSTPNSAYGAFEAGFLDSINAAIAFRRSTLEQQLSSSYAHFGLLPPPKPDTAGAILSINSAYSTSTQEDKSCDESNAEDDTKVKERLNLELLFTLLDVLCKYEHTLPASNTRIGSPHMKLSTHTNTSTDTVKQARASMKHASNFMSLPVRRASRGTGMSTAASSVPLSTTVPLSLDVSSVPTNSNYVETTHASLHTLKCPISDLGAMHLPAGMSDHAVLHASDNAEVWDSDHNTTLSPLTPEAPINKKPSWT